MPANPRYDLQGALTGLVPGLVLSRELLDAASARYAAIGFVPLGAGDVAPILAAVNTTDVVKLALPVACADSPITARAVYLSSLPPFPAKMVRFEDSNPDPIDDWSEFGGTQAA